MAKKIIKNSWFRTIWKLIGLCMFIIGILNHDWLLLLAGFLWNLEDIEIVHWEGKEYQD